MKADTEYILKTLCLKKIGRKTAFKLFENLSYKISNNEEWVDFIKEQSSHLKLPDYTRTDFEDAQKQYETILLKSEKDNIKYVSYWDNNYPILLKNIPDKPILLYYIGDISTLNKMPTLAVIGTREPSTFGFKSGERIAELFTDFGFNIVSGLAVGCDTAGHIGSLNKHGKTTAILAHGLDKIYPKENRTLAQDIIDNDGLLISEYHVGQSPLANYFVERDRIQAGLSLGIFVVETDIKGGTMHTVKFATEANRVISTLNHPKDKLDYPKTRGNQFLIKEKGAIPVGNESDITYLKNKLLKLFEQSTPTQQQNQLANNERIKLKVELNPKPNTKKKGTKPQLPELWD